MTAPKLVKERLPGDRYKTTGSIEGLVQGRRTIRELTIRNAEGGFAQLATLKDLARLSVEGGTGLDLASLASLPTQCGYVDFAALRDTDLGRLKLPETATMVGIFSPHASCAVSGVPGLPSRLMYLGLLAQGTSSGGVLQRFVDRVRWDNLGQLNRLDIHVDAQADGYPLEVDLGFLRHLPRLERADFFGVRHRRSVGPSPLEPPFQGLPKTLSWLRIETELPEEELKPQIDAYLGCHVSVKPLYPARPSNQPWWIYEPDADGSGLWIASGSFADHFAGQDASEEALGLRYARSLIKRADGGLLKRLDFDQEADGTMVMAKSREDMLEALALLGISAPNG